MNDKHSTIESIKKAMSGQSSDDVLELTEIVPDDDAETHLEKITQKTSNDHSNLSIEQEARNLESIDDVQALVTRLKNKNKKSTFCDVSMEDWILKLLKPQLSEWIEENLPGMVREIVENEIKKIMHK